MERIGIKRRFCLHWMVVKLTRYVVMCKACIYEEPEKVPQSLIWYCERVHNYKATSIVIYAFMRTKNNLLSVPKHARQKAGVFCAKG